MRLENDDIANNRVSVYLGIYHVEPDDVTRILGIQPTSFWRKGESHPRVERLIRKEHSWTINSPIYQRGTLTEQLDALIELLKPSLDKLECLPQHDVVLVCMFWADEKPIVRLTNEQMRVLAQIHASVDIDINYAEDPYEREPGEELTEDAAIVSLGIEGIEPDEVTRILRVPPTPKHLKYRSFPKLKRPLHKEYVWECDSPSGWKKANEEQIDELIERQIDALIGLLKPRLSKFAELPQHEVSLECMIYAGERPAVVLTKEQIEFLAQINAAVNIDDNYYEDPDNPIYRDLIISYDIPE